MIEGIILKGIGGFYYVDTAEGLIECKARGRFRKTVGKPIVGDRVTLEIQPEDGTGYLQTIAPRKNSLIRPAVANLDLVVAVASAAPPVTDPFLIDKVTAIAVHKNMDALVVINKTDANPGDELYETYRKSGIEVLRVSARTGDGIDALRDAILEQVIFPVLPPELLDEHTEYFINPTGRFVVGGPAGDSGLTGRKIIADTYGGMARHGGGAFSGKDPSKVDRTGAYMARYLTKNIVAAELAGRCEIELAYAIGLADPVSVMVDTFGTGRVSDEKIASWLMEHIDMRPGSITSRFELRRPIYRHVSCGGHFGENAVGLPWEWTDIAEVLQKEILS